MWLAEYTELLVPSLWKVLYTSTQIVYPSLQLKNAKCKNVFYIMQIEYLVKNMHVSLYPQKSSLFKPTHNTPQLWLIFRNTKQAPTTPRHLSGKAFGSCAGWIWFPHRWCLVIGYRIFYFFIFGGKIGFLGKSTKWSAW